MIERNKFFKPTQIEEKANSLLYDFQIKYGALKRFPIPVEKILENHLELIKVWEEILEKKEKGKILAGLVPGEKTVVLNELHRDYFEKFPGLEAFTIAHEIGHWELHIDKSALNSTVLPGFSRPYSQICRDGDKNWDEINANRFAAFLLMPKALLLPFAKDFNLQNWSDLYKLKDNLGVTISAVTNRLTDMNMLFIKDKRIYESKEAYAGQRALF